MFGKSMAERETQDKVKSRVEAIVLTPPPDLGPEPTRRLRQIVRKAERLHTYQMTKVHLNDRDTHQCVILNISDTGARIACDGIVTLPSRIVLVLPFRGAAVDAEVVWRDENEAGVRFLPPMSISDTREE